MLDDCEIIWEWGPCGGWTLTPIMMYPNPCCSKFSITFLNINVIIAYILPIFPFQPKKPFFLTTLSIISVSNLCVSFHVCLQIHIHTTHVHAHTHTHTFRCTYVLGVLFNVYCLKMGSWCIHLYASRLYHLKIHPGESLQVKDIPLSHSFWWLLNIPQYKCVVIYYLIVQTHFVTFYFFLQ